MFDYGFDAHTNKLFEALIQYPPDFEAAQQYIREGADIHACRKDEDGENILAQVILGYPHIDDPGENLTEEERDAYWSQFSGRYLPEIVQFFLQNGFDVTLDQQKYGADSLRNLTWSSYDRYILDAAKLLLTAGASYTYEDEDGESVIDWVGAKASLSANTTGNDADSQLFCAMWDILDAHRKGQDYLGIDSCLRCMGQYIDRVVTSGKLAEMVIVDILPSEAVILCDDNLYLVCGGKPLRINNYAEAAIDPREIHDSNILDVSPQFSEIIGKRIVEIRFPDFHRKNNGIACPDFIIQLTDGLSIQCCTCKAADSRQLLIHIQRDRIE